MATIEGYAIRWSERARIAGQFVEQFERGAFAESLRSDEQLFLYHHSVRDIVGRTGNGTLQLREDATGLHYSVDLPDTTLGRDTAELVRRGDVAGVSVGFVVEQSSDEVWSRVDGELARTIKRAALLETSLTPVPAYRQTSASVRAESAGAGNNAARDIRLRLKRKALVQAMKRSLEARERRLRRR